MADVIPIRKRAKKPATETDLVRAIMVAVNRLPYATLWRNQTGMLEDRNGRPVRFGLAVGSADLIGMVEVEPHEAGGVHYGRHVAIMRFPKI